MGVDLLTDLVSLSLYRSLQVLRRVVNFICNLQTNLGKKDNISSRFSSEFDLEKVFFLYESRVKYQYLKYECIDEVMSSKVLKNIW